MPCGHGVGSWGLQPLSSGIGPPSPSLGGGAGGLEAPGAEVKMVLSREEELLSPPGCPSGRLRTCGRSCRWGLEHHPGVSTWWPDNVSSSRLPPKILSGEGGVPQTPCPADTASSQERPALADALTQDSCSWSPLQTVVTLMTTSRPEWELERASGGRSCPRRCRIV